VLPLLCVGVCYGLPVSVHIPPPPPFLFIPTNATCFVALYIHTYALPCLVAVLGTRASIVVVELNKETKRNETKRNEQTIVYCIRPFVHVRPRMCLCLWLCLHVSVCVCMSLSVYVCVCVCVCVYAYAYAYARVPSCMYPLNSMGETVATDKVRWIRGHAIRHEMKCNARHPSPPFFPLMRPYDYRMGK
jgi:hypothetical protein